MMTACDLSAIAKPWEVQSKVRTCVISTQAPFHTSVAELHSRLTHIQLFAVIRHTLEHRLQEWLHERGTNDKVDREWHFVSTAISPSRVRQWLLTASCIKSNLVLFISLITNWQAQHFISVNYVIYTSPWSLHTQVYQYEQEASLAAQQQLPYSDFFTFICLQLTGNICLFQKHLLPLLMCVHKVKMISFINTELPPKK